MTEERAKCCGTCWWWVKYGSCEGVCCRDGSDMLSSESCSRWEKTCRHEEESRPIGPPDKLEEVDDGT